MKTQQCPTDQELCEFDIGQLSNERYEDVSDHLDSCPDCAQRFEKLDSQTDDVLQHLQAKLPQEILTDDSELEQLIGAAAALQDTSVNGQAETLDGGPTRHKPAANDIVAQILSPPEQDDELGRLGGYRVLNVIGMGGMGVVFKAEDIQLKRKVALKAMLPHFAASSTSARERFLREAQAMAAIHHDNIVTIHQVGQDGDVPFMAMHLLEGESLERRLSRERSLGVTEACRIAKDIAIGLAAAHAKGLTHRDIKPDNIWLEEDTKRVKILDFGLARLGNDEQQLTQAGAVVGTPSYLAPEQARGQEVDARADLFSLGVVLYQMLTGTRPFHRDSTLATLRAIDAERPSPPAEVRDDVPSNLSALVMQLLEKDPEQRVQTAREVISKLDALEDAPTEQESSEAKKTPVAVLDAAKPPASRNLILAAAAAGCVLLLMGVIITVKDKDGNILSRMLFPEAADVVVEVDGELEVAPHTTPGHAAVEPKPLAAQSGQFLPAMNSLALVQSPARLVSTDGEHAQSWTIATRTVPAPDSLVPALRPDGKLVAAFGNDGCVRVWDVEGKQLKQVLIGHEAGPAVPEGRGHPYRRTNSRRYGPVVWQGNTPLLATASRDGSLRVWDVERGRTVFTHQGERDNINMLAWSPDGTRLAAAFADDGSVRCWDTDQWEELAPLEPLQLIPRGMVWAPDSKTLAISTDRETILWTADNGTERELSEKPRPQTSVRWSPDGSRLASAIVQGVVAISDAVSLESVQQLKYADDSSGSPLDFAWSPDGQQMLVCWREGVGYVRQIHDVASGKSLRSLENIENDGLNFVEWLPDGGTAISGNQLVDLESGNVIKKANWLWDTSADGQKILSTETHGLPVVERFDAEAKEFELLVTAGRLPQVRNAAVWTPSGKSFAVDGETSLLCEWLPTPNFHAHDYRIASWSPDERHVHTTTGGIFEIRSWPDGEAKFRVENVTPSATAWSPDGSKFALAGTHDRTLRVIDIETSKATEPLSDPAKIGNYINAIAWSQDGSRIAVSGGNTGILGVLSAADGSLLCRTTLPEAAGRLHWADQLMWFGNSSVRVLNPENASTIQTINASVSPLQLGGWPTRLAIHFTEQRTLQFISAEGELREMETAGGTTTPLRPLRCEPVEFSPSGDYVAGDQGLIRRIWRTRDGQPIVSLLAMHQVYLISPEGHIWTRHLPGEPRRRWASSHGLAEMLVYVVQTESGQQTLTPYEFAKRYSWQNDPSKVTLK